ncbi:MAG: FISUMP domain-containing protein [Bacteroidales bacterium]|nr:FISUMP domain-containing protein [Bacteroidales bacterium]
MKKFTLSVLLGFAMLNSNAQDITISFQPLVSGTPIDSIQATNLRTGQIVKFLGNESLVLMKTITSINLLQNNLENGNIYPNPTHDDATFCLSTDKSEKVELKLYNANGQLLCEKMQNLAQGTHRFKFKFPIAGIYFISVLKNNETTSFKAVYTGEKVQNSSILYSGNEKLNSQKPDTNQLKSATTGGNLSYKDGDVILLNYYWYWGQDVHTTIETLKPTVSKTIVVEFVNCDIDNKSYKVVKIDTTWWMAENLAYLPKVGPPSVISATDPYYYVYDYDGTDVAAAKLTANYKTYGVLYNWHAAMAACPPGWHLPSDAEWTALTTFIGGEWSAGGKLRESGYSHWLSPNAYATNEIGFTALPAGYLRNMPNVFECLTVCAFWWTSTVYHDDWAWNRHMSYNSRDLVRASPVEYMAFSVRLVKD